MINISLDICWGLCGSGGCRWQDDEASAPFLSKSYKIYQTPRQALTWDQSFGIFLLLFCIVTIFVFCFFSQKGVDEIYQTPHKASPDLRLALFPAYFCNSSLWIVAYLIFVIFLHELNFWRIKFTPKKRVNYDKIHRKLPIFCVITAKYTVNWQFFALNL